MSTGSKKKRRIERVTSVELPPGVLGNLLGPSAPRPCARAAGAVRGRGRAAVGDHARLGAAAAVSSGRRAAARYRGPHAIRARRPDATTRRPAKRPAGWRSPRTIRIRRQLEQLRAKLENEVTELVAAKSFAEVDKLWDAFRLPLAEGTPEPTAEEREQQFQKFREALAAEGALDKFKTALNEAFAPLLEKGVLEKLPPEHDANDETIAVRPVGTDSRVSAERAGQRRAAPKTRRRRCRNRCRQKMPSPEVADRVFARLKPKLPATLKLNVEVTRQEQKNDGRRGPDADGRHSRPAPSWRTLRTTRASRNRSTTRRWRSCKLEYEAELDQRPLSVEVCALAGRVGHVRRAVSCCAASTSTTASRGSSTT